MVALESAELFRNLKPEELRALRQLTLERQCHAGQEIFREGGLGDGVYLVKEGVCDARHAPRIIHLQKDHRRPRRAHLGAQRAGPRGSVRVRLAFAEITAKALKR